MNVCVCVCVFMEGAEVWQQECAAVYFPTIRWDQLYLRFPPALWNITLRPLSK